MKKLLLVVLLLLSISSFSQIEAVVRKGGKIRKNPDPMGTVLLTFGRDTNINILDYYDGYYKIYMDTTYVYISDVWIELNDKLRQLKETKDKEKEIKDKDEIEIIVKTDEIENLRRKNEFIKEYGKDVWGKLQKGLIWIGMTDQMMYISQGGPERKNRTKTSYGSYEQWVYGGSYYYFENGILTSYQY
jgi:hypothetical protein